MRYQKLNINQKINVKQSIINWYENVAGWSRTAKKHHCPVDMLYYNVEVTESECEMVRYTKKTKKDEKPTTKS